MGSKKKKTQLSKNIQHLRKQIGETQEQFANVIGVSLTILSDYETA